MTPAPSGEPVTVSELLDQLADAMAWPRTRPARVVHGERNASINDIALCVDDAAIDGITTPGTAAVLLTPPSPELAGRGRRNYDVFQGDSVDEWSRAERVVIDASELLRGGAGGIDEQLAASRGMEPGAAPARAVDLDRVRLVAFVPADALEAVRSAVFAAGAGTIGDYTECSWSSSGTGTFRGGDSSTPAVGSAGEFEQVAEVRFETTLPSHLRSAVARALIAAHPYEEPAYDFVPTATPAAVGTGRIGLVEGVRSVVGVDMLSVAEQAQALQQFGTVLAGRLSRMLGRKVQLLAPLAFPAPVAAAPAASGAWRLYFDGGSRGNPGPAASAFVLYDPSGAEFERWHDVLGIATNNIAEYTGVLNGLRRAVALGIDELEIYGDSELIVKQLLGQYKVKNEAMKPLHAECVQLLRNIGTYSVQHVYRSDNAVADALVNEALDAEAARY